MRASIRGLARPFYSPARIAAWSSLPPLYHRWAMTAGGEAYVVAEEGGRVVGYAARRGREVTAVFVLPSRARAGLGAALLARVERDARRGRRPRALRPRARSARCRSTRRRATARGGGCGCRCRAGPALPAVPRPQAAGRGRSRTASALEPPARPAERAAAAPLAILEQGEARLARHVPRRIVEGRLHRGDRGPHRAGAGRERRLVGGDRDAPRRRARRPRRGRRARPRRRRWSRSTSASRRARRCRPGRGRRRAPCRSSSRARAPGPRRPGTRSPPRPRSSCPRTSTSRARPR